MSKSTFSLSWEAHRSNICSGLTVLQQNEEFVDMTLAADGHFVKVHQMIMALASPYFKDLISSAAGRHPVIFLNKISYSTLSAILEYIYTGEVLISIENLSDLIQTARELRIKGLEDMKLQNPVGTAVRKIPIEEAEPESNCQQDLIDNKESSEMDDEICYFEITDRDDIQSQNSTYSTVQLDEGTLTDTNTMKSIDISEMDENYEEIEEIEESEEEKCGAISFSVCPTPSESFNEGVKTLIQYTVSNQGSIQMILNRYMYYLKHSNRNNTRQWRCVDYLNKSKCPAIVMTRNNVALQRISAHIHGHHDRRIQKKIQAGAIYSAIQEAEEEGIQIKIKVKQDKIEKTNSTTDTPDQQTEAILS